MGSIKKQEFWLTESGLPFAEQGVKLSIKVNSVVFDEMSHFGHIQIFDTPFFGRILAIDGIINIADKTEFIYHEMMVNLPAIYHGNPETVLIIGGGDGGAARHAINIATVKRIVQVEVDKVVVDACLKHMPELSAGSLEHPKVNLIIGDGIEFVKNCKEKFDLIVLDVSDPVPGGPAEALLSREFYENVGKCLSENGVVLTHCGSLIFQAEKAQKITDELKKVFDEITMHIALVPEFELTEFGFLVCRNNKTKLNDTDLNRVVRELFVSEPKFLTPEVFKSTKVLSPYIQRLTGVVNH